MNNLFFKPTPIYKEFMILDMIAKDSNITQRKMSEFLGSAVSMINSYLDECEEKGYIKRHYQSTKTVLYEITKKGVDRRNVLNISYLNASQKIYDSAKSNIQNYLRDISIRGFKNILLYGAGEVAEILLNAINTNKEIDIEVVGVIDDDIHKQGEELLTKTIANPESLFIIPHDGILISSYTNQNKIMNNLLLIGYDKSKILKFFD
jgi:DNA-binding MarR family transcriptional regulator